MPEQYRRPSWHERNQTVETMHRAWKTEREAALVVEAFNAQVAANATAWFWPKVAAALTAKHPWVVIACESCNGVTDLDLRMKPRNPEASIRVVLRDVRCP